jgi:hypothetical protein
MALGRALGTTVEPVIPTELHGFTVKVGLAPYPPDAKNAHRKAIYAELRPTSRKAKRAMRRMNRERILGWVPLTKTGAGVISAHPNGPEAELAARDALQQASKLARQLVA